MNIGSFFIKFRFVCLAGFFILIFLVVGANLYNLQINEGQSYSARVQSRLKYAEAQQSPRGVIYFTDLHKNKIPAALNKGYPVIFAAPKEIEDAAEAASTLHEILDLDAANLQAILANSRDLYRRLVRKADDGLVAEVEAANLKGIYAGEESLRYYPFQNLAAQVLGFVGPGDDGQEGGRYGLESFYEKKLTRATSQSSADTNLQVKKVAEDVFLTIDRNIESRAEEILGDLVTTYRASGGSVIVEEPSTGKIIAMANYPDFNPNDYAGCDFGRFANSAVQGVYEPGSIFKIITMAASLDAGKITPETKYYDDGSATLNGRVIKNWDLKAHGLITMTEVLEQSVNTGAVFAERQLGHSDFYNYLMKFGFKELTGVNLPGEVVGSLRNLKNPGRDINYATASFGQGVSVTPLALISAVSAIANGGFLMRPYITEDLGPKIIRQVISKEAASATTRMMVSAVNKAEVAAIPQYAVAGKTGTAQVPDFQKGGYTDEVINTYAGYAPAFAPRFAILIKLDKPAGAPLAGVTVVPAFRDLAQFILNYYNVAPDLPLATSH